MSTNHGHYGLMQLTTFSAVRRNSSVPMLQLTLPRGEYVQLTRDGVEQLHEALGEWLKDKLPDEAAKLRGERHAQKNRDFGVRYNVPAAGVVAALRNPDAAPTRTDSVEAPASVDMKQAQRCEARTQKPAWLNPLAPRARCAKAATTTRKDADGKDRHVCGVHAKQAYVAYGGK